MKRILPILFAASILLFTSCSEDSPAPRPSVVTAKIDGVDYTFNTINVHPVDYPDEGYTDLEVTASIDNNPDNRISFVIEKFAKGTSASWYFAYFLHETAYPKEPDFIVDVTDNDNHHLKGTFSGQVKADVEPFDVIQFENGTFDIIY